MVWVYGVQVDFIGKDFWNAWRHRLGVIDYFLYMFIDRLLFGWLSIFVRYKNYRCTEDLTLLTCEYDPVIDYDSLDYRLWNHFIFSTYFFLNLPFCNFPLPFNPSTRLPTSVLQIVFLDSLPLYLFLNEPQSLPPNSAGPLPFQTLLPAKLTHTPIHEGLDSQSQFQECRIIEEMSKKGKDHPLQ